MKRPDVESAILKNLYEAYFRGDSLFNLHKLRDELGMTENEFWKVVDYMTDRGIIQVRGAGGHYRITARGVINAEQNNIAPDELEKENEHIRTVTLDALAKVYEESGSYGGLYLDNLSKEIGVEIDPLMNNLHVLEDLGYVEAVALSTFQITYHGLEAVEDWRKRSGLAAEFELLSALEPRARGRAFQKLLAKLVAHHGWSQDEGARTSNEEMDVILYKGREYYLAECKWEKDPIEAAVVRELYGKLGNRVGVQGILVSMSGFTAGAVKQTEDYANDRVILFFGPEDLRSLITGKASFDAVLSEKYQQLITRRKVVFA